MSVNPDDLSVLVEHLFESCNRSDGLGVISSEDNWEVAVLESLEGLAFELLRGLHDVVDVLGEKGSIAVLQLIFMVGVVHGGGDLDFLVLDARSSGVLHLVEPGLASEPCWC